MIVRIKNLKAHTIIGIHDWEKKQEREVILNIEMECDGAKSIASDDIKDTLDYDAISQMVVAEVAKSRFELIEKLASHLVDLILQDKRITKARLELDKPNAIQTAESVSVVVERFQS
jgi:FolB domain-containing protein